MSYRRLTYACTVFLSSTLLFLLQPIVARTILPAFGGSAAVWTTVTLFFQAVLLLGYLYAHLLTTRLGARGQMLAHVAMLAAALVALRMSTPAAPGNGTPLLQVLAQLQVSVGLPYFMLSTTGPLIQSWYGRTFPGETPYRLFALSNAASLVGLISYPFVWERLFTLRTQTLAWSLAYGAFSAAAALAAVLAKREAPVERPHESSRVPPRSIAFWMVLAFCPAVLWLAVANQLSQSVAAIPFLWVLPLTLYLLSFVVTFESERFYRREWFRWLLPPAWVAMVIALFSEALGLHFKWIIALYGVSLFIVCLFCHGELARRKPDRGHLTAFYVWVAVGGALGSAFVALAAPVLFHDYLELPLTIGLAIVLGAVLAFGVRSRGTLLRVGATAVAAVVASIALHPNGTNNRLQARNFYGALRVQDQGSVETATRALYSGTVLHGVQWLSPTRSRWATAYYGPDSGVGRLLAAEDRCAMRVGVIGLGVGTVAAYARPGDTFRFYEINPLVVRVARADFRYLAESHGRIEVVEGDARVRLEQEPAQAFDVLVVDAFSGDSIPVHLLTVEAFSVYQRHLASGGVLAMHITNKYMDLASLLAATGARFGMQSVVIASAADPMRRTSAARWVLLGSPGGHLELVREHGRPAPMRQNVPVWTDDFHNVFQVIQ